jgi:hypothetical protein
MTPYEEFAKKRAKLFLEWITYLEGALGVELTTYDNHLIFKDIKTREIIAVYDEDEDNFEVIEEEESK